MDYSHLLYSPVYDLLGVAGFLTPNLPGAGPIPVTVLDKTAGVDVSEAIDLVSVRPAAIMQMRDLVELGLRPADLDGGLIEFNGGAWLIDMHQLRPSPDGARSGELLMFLLEHEAGSDD